MGGRRDHGQCPAEVILHLRRLDALLKDHGLDHTAHTLEMEAGLFFEAAHLEQLVRQGLWASAHRYLRCFSALWGDGDGDGAATKYATLLSSLSHQATTPYLPGWPAAAMRAVALPLSSGPLMRSSARPAPRKPDARTCTVSAPLRQLPLLRPLTGRARTAATRSLPLDPPGPGGPTRPTLGRSGSTEPSWLVVYLRRASRRPRASRGSRRRHCSSFRSPSSQFLYPYL